MTKKILFTLLAVLGLSFLYFNSTKESEIQKIRKQHATFLKNHSFNEVMKLSKKERRARGLSPNKYFEQEYLNEMNPRTGKTNKLELLRLQEDLNEKRSLMRVPGDASDNAWVERGPNNVGGRTRAVIFDPNDETQETVFAGGVSGGLWKNTNISNAASEWVQVAIPENLAISCITIDPNDTKIWYLGTGESYVSGDVNGNGVWRSADGGNSWSNVFGGVNGASIFEGNAVLKVNSPVSLTGNYSAVLATDFGGELNTPISGDLVLAVDGASPTEDGCTDLINPSEMNGKIAVIRRGGCPFVDKANNAQDAGAIAVIIVNNAAGFPAGQAGTDAGITIPSLMVSKTDGDKLIAALENNNINITLSKTDNASGYNVSNGVQHVNDIIVRNNNGVSEVYISAGEAFYSDAAPNTLIGINDVGIYKSTNGTSFSKLNIPKREDDGVYEPNNLDISADNSIYLTTTNNVFGDGGGAVLKSTNGIDFSLVHQVTNGLRTEVVCSKTDADKIYILSAIGSENSPVKVFKTENGFTSVETLSLPSDADNGIPAKDFTRGQSGYNLLLRIDPSNDDIVYLGGIDLFKSENGGDEWSQISKWSNNNNLGSLDVPLVHADQHGLSFSSPTRMVFGNDGGVYFSNDGGSTIESRNLGYNTLQFYTVGVGPMSAFSGDYFIAGAQDNGSQLFEDSNSGINGSVQAYGGDGAASFFDQDGTDKYFIVNYVYNQAIELYNFETNQFRTISDENEANGDFINQEALDSNLDRLYSNYSNQTEFLIKRYSNIKSGTVSSVNLTNDLMDDEPSVLEVSPHTTNASNLFVGLKNGKVLLVKKANSFINTWSEITGKDFVGTISDISFGETEEEIFVTMHNYGVRNIWFTNNGGVDWQDKEGDLPDIPVKAILQNPLNRKEVIIGTDLGVWRTSDITVASPKWVQSYNGMSNVKVTDLDLRDDNTVFASTYGRGVFSGQFTAEVASLATVLADEKAFTVYPTVSNGNFTIYAKSDLGKSDVIIFDINGKQVYKSLLDFSNKEKQEVSVNLNSGVYIVNVTDDKNKKSSNKIVIE